MSIINPATKTVKWKIVKISKLKKAMEFRGEKKWWVLGVYKNQMNDKFHYTKLRGKSKLEDIKLFKSC